LAYVALSALYLGMFLAYMGFRSDSQGGHLFEVIVPLSLLNFLFFGVGTMFLVMVPEALDHAALAPYLLPAQALVTLGFLCFLIGYAWSFRNTAPSPLGRYVPKGLLVYLIPAGLGAVGMSVHRLQVEGMLNYQGISPVFSFLGQFGFLFYFGWYLAWYMTWAKRLRTRVAVPMLAAMTVLAAVVLFSTFGGKALAVTLLGMPAMAYYEVKRKLPLKSIVIVLLIFVFVIFPVYNTFRQVNRSLDTARRVDRTLNMARNWDSEKYLDASLFAFLKRCGDVTSVAALVSDAGRRVDYKYGETLLLAPIGLLIPRFLWPEAEHQHRARVRGDVRPSTRTIAKPRSRRRWSAISIELRRARRDRRDVAPGNGIPVVLPAIRSGGGVRPDPKVDLRHTAAVRAALRGQRCDHRRRLRQGPRCSRRFIDHLPASRVAPRHFRGVTHSAADVLPRRGKHWV
jgi:hypothetical protein